MCGAADPPLNVESRGSPCVGPGPKECRWSRNHLDSDSDSSASSGSSTLSQYSSLEVLCCPTWLKCRRNKESPGLIDMQPSFYIAILLSFAENFAYLRRTYVIRAPSRNPIP
ncbi:unnamed protein product [Darwinula stevensoni]|uniref:Uncharacterized protein n=1 Tax=Darwinula stevensoni TaxID=69355 RepID=A0A7R8X505_9CRUS|nr:unnamed protein product [Darwinula stevensoni]CAG0880362.1 unnamed protein product [Darwinula stevensoni]